MSDRSKEPVSFLATVEPCSAFYPDFPVDDTKPAWFYDVEKDIYFCAFGPNNSAGVRPFPVEYVVGPFGRFQKETQPATVYTITGLPYWCEILERETQRCRVSEAALEFLKEKNPDLTDLICTYAGSDPASDETMFTMQVTVTGDDGVWITVEEELPNTCQYLGLLCNDFSSYDKGWKRPYPNGQWSIRPHSLQPIRPLKALMVTAIGNFPTTSVSYKHPWNEIHPYPWAFELVPKNQKTPIVEGWTTSKELDTLFSYNVENKTWYFNGGVMFLMARTKAVRDQLANCFGYSVYNLQVKLDLTDARKTYQTHIPRVSRITL